MLIRKHLGEIFLLFQYGEKKPKKQGEEEDADLCQQLLHPFHLSVGWGEGGDLGEGPSRA